MAERLSRVEIFKDAAQDIVESGASTVGQVASIITGAVRDVATAVGTQTPPASTLPDPGQPTTGPGTSPEAPTTVPDAPAVEEPPVEIGRAHV
mgnify:CR=1 FL=1